MKKLMYWFSISVFLFVACDTDIKSPDKVNPSQEVLAQIEHHIAAAEFGKWWNPMLGTAWCIGRSQLDSISYAIFCMTTHDIQESELVPEEAKVYNIHQHKQKMYMYKKYPSVDDGVVFFLVQDPGVFWQPLELSYKESRDDVYSVFKIVFDKVWMLGNMRPSANQVFKNYYDSKKETVVRSYFRPLLPILTDTQTPNFQGDSLDLRILFDGISEAGMSGSPVLNLKEKPLKVYGILQGLYSPYGTEKDKIVQDPLSYAKSVVIRPELIARSYSKYLAYLAELGHTTYGKNLEARSVYCGLFGSKNFK